MIIRIEHINPSIPARNFDWAAYFDCDDGGETICGYGSTKTEAVTDLIDRTIDGGLFTDEIIQLILSHPEIISQPTTKES